MKQNMTIEKCKIDLINALKKGQITQTKTAVKRASKLLDGNKARFAEFINSKDEEGVDAFTVAWKNNQVGVVKFLLSLGCININEQNSKGQTPLMHVIEAGNVEIAKLIASTDKTDLGVTDHRGKTAIILAAWKGQTDILAFLLTKQPDIEQRDSKSNCTLLGWAAYGGCKNTLVFLIKNKANIEAEDNNKCTPLHHAVSGGHLEVVQYLIEKGANIEAKNKYQCTPLYYAARDSQLKIMYYLICQDANIEAEDQKGHTALRMAAGKGHVEIAELLLMHGANIEATSLKGTTALRIAVDAGYTEMVKLLLKYGAKVEIIRHKSGSTVLLVAATAGYTDIVKLLLEHGANIEAEDKNGYTPLQVAINKGYKEIVKLLLEYGANAEAKISGAGYTPLQVAINKGYKEIVKLLLEYGANAEVTDVNGNTILHMLYRDVARPFNNDDTAELAFFIISRNKDKEILKLNYKRRSALDLAIKCTEDDFAKNAIKPFLLHKDFPQYFIRLNKDFKHWVKYYFNVAKIKDDYKAIEKMKELVIKDLGITDLARSIITNLSSEPEWKDSALKEPCISYFLKHPQEWVDFVLFHKKIHNLRLQNKHGEADFIEQIIPKHLHLTKGNLGEVIGGLSIFLLPQKTQSTLVVAKKVPQALYFLIGQFLSVEDIQGLYKDYIEAKEKQIPNWKERQKIILSQFAIKAHEEDELVEDIIDQDDGQSNMAGEDSYSVIAESGT